MLWRNRGEEQRTVSEFPRVLLALSTEPKHHLCLGGVGACSTHQLAAIKQAAVQVRALDAINQSALSVCSDKPSSAAGRIWVAKQRPPATRVRHLELHHTAGWAGGQLRFAWLTCGIKKSTFHNFLTAQKPCPRGTATLELRFGQFPVFAFSAGAVRCCATRASGRGPGRRAPPQGTAFFAYIPYILTVSPAVFNTRPAAVRTRISCAAQLVGCIHTGSHDRCCAGRAPAGDVPWVQRLKTRLSLAGMAPQPPRREVQALGLLRSRLSACYQLVLKSLTTGGLLVQWSLLSTGQSFAFICLFYRVLRTHLKQYITVAVQNASLQS